MSIFFLAFFIVKKKKREKTTINKESYQQNCLLSLLLQIFLNFFLYLKIFWVCSRLSGLVFFRLFAIFSEHWIDAHFIER